MATEFTIKLEHQPGALARVGGVLGDAGVNITAIQGMPCEGAAIVQLLADDPGRAKAALRKAEIPYSTREVLLVNVLNEPGTLGDVALVMAEAGINIDAVYLTITGQVALGVDDLNGAIQVAAGMAVV
jgi:hypothetical protein